MNGVAPRVIDILTGANNLCIAYAIRNVDEFAITFSSRSLELLGSILTNA